MAADNTTNKHDPFDSGDPIGPSIAERQLEPLDPTETPKLGRRTVPQTSFSERVKTKSPPSVHVCLECETFYPDADGWDYCPNCSATVFKVDRA